MGMYHILNFDLLGKACVTQEAGLRGCGVGGGGSGTDKDYPLGGFGQIVTAVASSCIGK